MHRRAEDAKYVPIRRARGRNFSHLNDAVNELETALRAAISFIDVRNVTFRGSQFC